MMNKPYSTYRISIDHEHTIKVDWSDTRERGNWVEGKLNYHTEIANNPEVLSLLEDASTGSLSDRQRTRQLGEILFHALLDEGLRFRFLDLYRNVKQENGYLRVELRIDENRLTKIAAIPWEFMCLPKTPSQQEEIWLAANPHIAFSRSRSLDAIPESLRLAEGEKLKIALVVSKPSKLGPVDFEPVQEVLSKLQEDYGHKIEILPIVDHAIIENIENILDEKPHIFHFIGHGQLAERDGSEQGQIALVHDIFVGKADWVNADFFAGLFTKHTPSIVLMQACEGAMRSESKALVDVAAKIGQQNVPVIVAMQYEVSNTTACRFSVKFYESLAKGSPVDIAAQEGRFNVAKRQYQGRDFATPVLFSGVKDGYLFHLPNEQEMSPEELRGATVDLLQGIERKFEKTYLSHSKHPITLKGYVPIRVTLEPHRRDVESLGGYAEVEEDLKLAYANKAAEELKRQELDWLDAKQQHQRIMVLADPGMGKSTLLRIEALTIAQEGRQSLENGSKSVKEIILPILIRLPKLAEALKDPAAKVTDVILSLLEAEYESIFQKYPKFQSVLKQRLQEGKCILLLDALDEVLEDNLKINLTKKLNDFAPYFSCPIISTSRIVGYGGSFINGHKEIEIIPFRDKQIEQYIETWFNNASGNLSDKSVNAAELIREIRSKPQVRGLAQTPLLLSLICSLYQQEGLTLPARRCELYERAVYYMLGGWQTDNERLIKDEKSKLGISSKHKVLEELAYQFSLEGAQIFKFKELEDKLESYLKSGTAPTSLVGVSSEKLIDELTNEDGILQLWTQEDLKVTQPKRRYLFLHRTFQEYLTASYLNRVGIEKFNLKELVWNYDWHETLTLLAGLMDEPNKPEKPMALIEAIIAQKDDIFQTQLLLAGRCLAECRELSHPLVNQIIERIYQFWLAYPDAWFIQSVVVAIGQNYEKVVEKLLSTLNDREIGSYEWKEIPFIGYVNYEVSGVNKRAAGALAKIGSKKAVEGLIAILNSKVAEKDVRTSAISALGSIGNEKVVDSLIFALNHDKVNDVRLNAAIALGNIGGNKAVEALISSLYDKELQGKEFLIPEALGKIGSHEAIEGLVSFCNPSVHNLKDSFEVMDVERVLLYIGNVLNNIDIDKIARVLLPSLNQEYNDLGTKSSLANISSDTALEELLSSLTHENRWMRISVEWALETIESDKDKVVRGLLSFLKDKNCDVRVRSSAASALGKLGNTSSEKSVVVEDLLSVLNDKHCNVDLRSSAAFALGEIVSDEALKGLLSFLDNNECNYLLKGSVLGGLRAIGNDKKDKIVKGLLSSLNHEDSFVKGCAIRLLGELGNDEVVEKIFPLLDDEENTEVKLKVVEALGKIGSDKAVEKLLSALDDREMKGMVVRELGDIGIGYEMSDEVVEKLLPLLDDKKDKILRQDTAQTLGKIKVGDETSDKVVEKLLFLLDDQEKSVKWSAVDTLVKIGCDKAVEKLLFVIVNDLDVKRVVGVLVEIGSLTALECLVQLPDINLFDKDIFPVVRKLVIKHSKSGASFIPVRPEESDLNFV